MRAIAVPYHMGECGVSVGAGAACVASACGIPSLDLGPKAAYQDVNRAIAAEVAGGTRFVIAGNCNSCLGTLGGLDPRGLNIVWFDAHADFNTPETSLSGSFEGMCLNYAVQQFRPASVMLLGTRDLDPEEPRLLQAAGVRMVHSDAFNPEISIPSGRVYLHIDIDVLDPLTSPGAACTTPGGLQPDVLISTLESILRRCTVEAAALTNYLAARDDGGVTLRHCMQIAEMLRAP